MKKGEGFKFVRREFIVFFLLVLFAFLVFAVDTNLPGIFFQGQTPSNNSVQPSNSIVVNVSSSDDLGEHYVLTNFDNSLVLWMRMDDVNSSGDPQDISGYGNNGTKVGVVINSTNGYWGNGTYFNGVSYISLPVSNSLGFSSTATVCAWINPNQTSALAAILKRGGNGGGTTYQEYVFRVTNAGALAMATGAGGSANTISNSSDGIIFANVWQHVCAKINESGQMLVYKDGVDVTAGVGSAMYGYVAPSVAFVGATGTTTGRFQGFMDDLVVFNRSLSGQEILSLYNATANQYYHRFSSLSEGIHNFQSFDIDRAGNRNQTERTAVSIDFCSSAANGTTFITSVTNSSALINAFFNEPVDYYIAYGTASGNYNINTSVYENQSTNTQINVYLTNLSENTRYYYRPYYRRNATSENYCAFQEERNFTTTKPAGSQFTFVHMTDSHWYKTFYVLPDEDEMNSFISTAASVRTVSPSFIVDTGDLSNTHTASPAETYSKSQGEADARWQMTRNNYSAELPFPTYFSLGNHEGEIDFDGVANHTMDLMNWSTNARLKYLPQPTNSTYRYGGNNATSDKNSTRDSFMNYNKPLEDYYAFDFGDATFIVLDTYRYSSMVGAPQEPNEWTLGKEQFEWLNKTLATSTKKWKFIFGHHIVGGSSRMTKYNYGDGGGNYSYSGNESYGQKAINPLMERYNAQFFVYGHMHFFAHDWANWSSYNRTNYVNYVLTASSTQTGDCLIAARANLYDNEICQNGYTKYDVSPQNVTFSYINTTGSVIYNYTLSNTAPRISTSYTNNTEIHDNLTFQYLDNEYDNAKNCSIFVDDVQRYTGFDLMNGTTVTNSLTSLRVGDAEEFNWYVNCSDGALSNRTILFTSIANITSSSEAAAETAAPSSGGGAPSYIVSKQSLDEGYEVNLAKNFKVNFYLDDSKTEKHTLVVNSVSKDSVTITVSSEPVTFTLKVGDVKKLDLNNNGFYELEVSLKEIKGYFAKVSLKSINEKIAEEEVVETGEEIISETEKPLPEESGKEINWFVVGGCVLVIVVSVVGLVLVLSKRKRVPKFSRQRCR